MAWCAVHRSGVHHDALSQELHSQDHTTGPTVVRLYGRLLASLSASAATADDRTAVWYERLNAWNQLTYVSGYLLTPVDVLCPNCATPSPPPEIHSVWWTPLTQCWPCVLVFTTVAVGHIAGHTNVVCTAQLATLLASGWPVRRPYLLMVVESHRASGVAAVT